MSSEQSFSSTQQIPILLSLVLFHRRSNPGSTTLEARMLTDVVYLIIKGIKEIRYHTPKYEFQIYFFLISKY